jgi:hypothetical protein
MKYVRGRSGTMRLQPDPIFGIMFLTRILPAFSPRQTTSQLSE